MEEPISPCWYSKNIKMDKLKLLIPLAFLLLSCSNSDEKQWAVKDELNGTVVKIVDGDTFDLLTKENSTIRIRLSGIDCPERKQDYYQVAKDALGSFIFKKEVQLVTFGKDRNKRVIAAVFLNGENINLAMIRDGYAWHYKKYSSDLTYANAEKEARAAKKGLWEMPDPIAPWDFRHK